MASPNHLELQGVLQPAARGDDQVALGRAAMPSTNHLNYRGYSHLQLYKKS